MKKTIPLLILLTTVSVAAKAQWQQTSGPGGGQINCLAVKGTILFAGTETGGVFLTSDGGANWTPANTGLPNLHISSFLVNDTDIFAGHGNGLSRSTDNGATWILASLNYPVACIALAGANLLSGTTWHLFRSIDYGQSWAAVSLPYSTDYVTAAAANAACAFVSSGFDGGMGDLHNYISRSSDSGATWTWSGINDGLNTFGANTFLVNGSDVFAGTCSGIYLSPDSGITWTPVNTGLTSLQVMSLAATGTDIFAGTSGGGVFYSPNNGNSWSPMNAGLTDLSVFSLAISATDLYAGTDSSGVWKFPLSQVAVKRIEKKCTVDIYPNPAKEMLTVETAGTLRSYAEICNIRGQVIMAFAFSRKHQINIEHIKSGIYLLRVRTDEGVATKKFIKW